MTPSAIRAAGAPDATALARLRYEFRGGIAPVAETEPEFVQRCAKWMTRSLGAGGAWRCWAADVGDALVGTIWLHLLEKLPNPVAEPECHAYVSSLYVRPQYRGRGLGSALLTACLRECESQAVDAVILWPTPPSRSLYLRHGFAVHQDLLERRMWTPPTHRDRDSTAAGAG